MAEVTAATLYGGNDQMAAEMMEQASNQITFDFLKALKKKAVSLGKNAVGGLKKKFLGGAAQVDADVAQFILSELANGNPAYYKALGEVQSSKGHFLSQVESEVDEQIRAEFFKESWEKIKNMFARKK